MKSQLYTAMGYVREHKQVFGISVIVVIGAAILIGLFIYNQPHGPQIDYQPTKACDMLTPSKAMDVLGNDVNNVEANKPVISGNVATSKCAYTDKKTNKDQQTQVSIFVLSAINENGIAQIKTDFTKLQKQTPHAQPVVGLGDAAYFNQDSGILYVINNKQLIMVYYGVGENVEPKPLADVVALAHEILK